jgi:hypothetical protein
LTIGVFAAFNGKDAVLSGYTKLLLAVGLFTFILSGGLATWAGYQVDITKVSIGTLYSMLCDHWTDSEPTALSTTAYAKAVVLQRLRPGTDQKNKIYLAASLVQVAGMLVLTLLVLFAFGSGEAKPNMPSKSIVATTSTTITTVTITTGATPAVTTSSLPTVGGLG